MSELVPSPLRLAFRVEGKFWRCYIAKIDTMEGATEIGAVVMRAVEDHPEIKLAFMDTMRDVMKTTLAAIGLPGATFPNPPTEAPQNERSGRA